MKCINEMGDISGDINNVMRFRAVARPKYSVPCSTSHYGNRLCHHDSSYGIISLSKSKEITGFVSFYRSRLCQQDHLR